ncbi:putative membrane protein [Hyella patelloides LEGE 07179]|uniref:Putative membrane protein n=1 Tax=Hyella patelloides LEGE 07179 TaxID=945734 RepID=A0A563VN40_9CYAN|nr:SHOCT domain-containing protein [Hyella patelloides]VEP12753.1 putative membrane protein [Hyella patelloides LEGE 07179]
MLTFDKFFSHYKNRRIAIILALLGTITPLAGLQKFYLGQPLWGIIYLLLWSTPIPRIACAIDLVWYVVQDGEQFEYQFNGIAKGKYAVDEAQQVQAIADALRKLDSLREDGLMTEYEFEQKRRQLLEKVS